MTWSGVRASAEVEATAELDMTEKSEKTSSSYEEKSKHDFDSSFLRENYFENLDKMCRSKV